MTHAPRPARRGFLRIAGGAASLLASPYLAAQAGARSLMLYSSMPVDDMQPIVKAFGAETGIELQTWRGSSEQVVQRVLAETQAGRQIFDVVESHTQSLEALRQAQALLPLTQLPAYTPPAGLTPAHGQWSGLRLTTMVCAWNSRLVPEAEAPRSYEDLLHPRWRGRITLEVDNQVWYGAMFDAMGVERARAWFDALARQGVTVRKGMSLIANLMAAGEVAISPHISDFKALQLEQAGAPVRHRVLTPALVNDGVVAVGRLSARTEEASRLLRFLQGGRGQGLLREKHHRAAVPLEPPGPGGVQRLSLDGQPAVVMGPGYVGGEAGRRWREQYRDFLKRAQQPL